MLWLDVSRTMGVRKFKEGQEMKRLFFVLCVVVAFFGSSSCAVFWNGETQGDLVMKRAHADAIRLYGKQYRPDNLGTAASPFGTSRRIEVQAPAGTRTSVYADGNHPVVSSGW